MIKKQELRERQRSMKLFMNKVNSEFVPKTSEKKHLELLSLISKIHACPKPLKAKSIPVFQDGIGNQRRNFSQ